VALLLLVRHGETEWNRTRRFQGHADPPLNETGRGQARALAAELAGERLEFVYASDLARARETAEIIAAPHGVPVVAEPDLREIDVGSWMGLTREEVDGREWDGETREAHSERVLSAILEIAARHDGAAPVLIVTHGGCIRRLFEATGHEDRPAPACCETFRVVTEEGTFRGID
jgi:broad specificity phosphatase PhoE